MAGIVVWKTRVAIRPCKAMITAKAQNAGCTRMRKLCATNRINSGTMISASRARIALSMPTENKPQRIGASKA